MTWAQLIQLLLVGAFSMGGAWVGARKDNEYLRRDVDHAHKRLDEHDKQFTEIYRTWP
jgi:hypothetical protein